MCKISGREIMGSVEVAPASLGPLFCCLALDVAGGFPFAQLLRAAPVKILDESIELFHFLQRFLEQGRETLGRAGPGLLTGVLRARPH